MVLPPPLWIAKRKSDNGYDHDYGDGDDDVNDEDDDKYDENYDFDDGIFTNTGEYLFFSVCSQRGKWYIGLLLLHQRQCPPDYDDDYIKENTSYGRDDEDVFLWW